MIFCVSLRWWSDIIRKGFRHAQDMAPAPTKELAGSTKRLSPRVRFGRHQVWLGRFLGALAFTELSGQT